LTAEGVAIPPNTTAELKRNMARLTVLHEQIAAIEKTRLEHGGCELPLLPQQIGLKAAMSVVAKWSPVSARSSLFPRNVLK
jgi:hypothetical protein